MFRGVRFLLQQTFHCHHRSVSNMRVVGLISGGKDSCFNLLKCVAENHEVVALANLHPANPDAGELDSYMYQTAGHEIVEAVGQALNLPLHRRALQGTSLSVGGTYEGPHAGDEVEDLYELIREVKEAHNVEAVAVGAVLSDYQRVRVENVCSRLGLTCLGYLWAYDQMQLLQEMIACQMDAILVKVASIGLDPAKHLNKPISSLMEHLIKLNKDYGVHVCGEGGEYESITLDCPLYNSKIVIDECEVVNHTKTDIAPVGYLKVLKYHLEPKPAEVTSLSWADRVKKLPMKTSRTFTEQFFSKVPQTEGVTYTKREANNMVNTWPEAFKSFVKTSDNELLCSLQAESSGDVAADTKRLMDRLQDILTSNSYTFSNVVYALLYISDMSQFANINAVYTTYYGINPPPRICVETVLPNSSLFHAQVLCSREPKATRHVQGVSHWAPSCIGPYSQTAKVGSLVFVSGQIPLVPGAMKELPTGFPGQCNLALDHAMSVGATMEVSTEHIVTAHCYVYREEDAAYCLGPDIAGVRIPKQVDGLCIVVPRLPKDVLVEWHVNFDIDRNILHSVSASGDSLTDVCDKLTASLQAGNTYYMFYSATTINVDHLLQGLQKTSCQLIPIPVVKVVSRVEQLADKCQAACVKVPGFCG